MFQERLKEDAAYVQAVLDAILKNLHGPGLQAAMLYAVQGGKGLRGFLVMESARLYGIEPKVSVYAAAAVEALHSYSLIHDDLPCMDDDDMRRGRPTVHVKWDEATAVLAGDALQTMAFELLTYAELGFSERRLELVMTLAHAAGARGMVLGQAQDIAAESATTPLSLAEITELQRNKTGLLIRWSAEAGPILAGEDPYVMRQYARSLGLAFQIADDILDVEGDEDTAGKAVRKDAGKGKATFVSLLGLDGAKKRAQELVDEAIAALSDFGSEADILRDAARFVIARNN